MKKKNFKTLFVTIIIFICLSTIRLLYLKYTVNLFELKKNDYSIKIIENRDYKKVSG